MDEPKVVELIVAIPLDQIIANEDANCRDKIDPMKVLSLWKTIEKEGLLQPVVVRKVDKGYELICGFRRYKAHVVGCAKTINSKVVTCSDADAKVFNLIENLEREQLNLLEEAKSVQKLMFAGWTQDRIAKRFSVTRTWVIGRQKLLQLPEEIQQEAAAGYLKLGHIDALVKLTTPEQYEIVKQIKEKALQGEKTNATALKPKTPSNVVPKRPRSKPDILDMLGLVMQKLGPGITTRAIAWAAGEISSDDFLLDIHKEEFNE